MALCMLWELQRLALPCNSEETQHCTFGQLLEITLGQHQAEDRGKAFEG